MTQHEKKFLVAGLTFGLMLALVAYAVMRLRYPGRSAAQSQEAPILQYEAASEPATSQHTEQVQADTSVSSIQLDQKEQTDIGVETVEVRRRNLQRALMAVAKVDEPETQLASISARIGGRIDKLYLDFTGQQVRRGQTIASLYSPEVFSAAEEYRLSLENRKRLGTGAEPLAVSGAEDLVNASRRRLELWGLTTQQLDEIASSAKSQIELPIYSTVSGIVTERKVTQGQYVNAGEVLFTVTDLSTIWVKADVYQPDLPSVHTGQPVEITSDSLPGTTTLHGRVAFLDTSINPQTRTASARIEVPNPSMRLRPGMFVQVRFAAAAGHDFLAVPRSAVLDTGIRKFVYVAKGNGEFEGRQVQLGPASTDYYPVLAGLKEGERIVSQGSFLIDSQTRITGGMTGMFGGSKEFDHAQAEHGQVDQGQVQALAVPQIKFTFRSDPQTPRGNSDATLHVTVLDASGKPVTDVQIKVTLIMPAMPAMGMGEMRAATDLTWKGSDYAGTIKVPTSGSWNVEVNASRNGQLLGSSHARLNAQ